MDFLRVERSALIVLPGEAAEKLSLEALGFLAWAAHQGAPRLAGLPAVARSLGLTEDHLSAILTELSRHGYAELEVMRGPAGRLNGRRWVVWPFGRPPAPEAKLEEENHTSPGTDGPSHGRSTESTKNKVSAASSSGTETEGEGKVPASQDTVAESRIFRVSAEISNDSGFPADQSPPKVQNDFSPSMEVPATKQKTKSGKKQASARKTAPQSQEKRAYKEDTRNKNQLTVEDGWGQEVSPSAQKEIPPGGQKKESPYRRKPVNAWNAGDFVAYLLDQAAAHGKTVLTPKAAMGQHLRWLLEKARTKFGEQGPLAVKDLVDEYWKDPDVHGTGWLLREAEWYWGRWRPPVEEGWQW